MKRIFFILFLSILAHVASAATITATTDKDISRALKARGYPERTWPGITRELKAFLVNIDFPVLRNKIKQAGRDPEGLRGSIAELGLAIKRNGALDLQDPHPLIKLLVNSLGRDDILSIKEEEKREIFACSAISQLASIILELMGIDAGIIIAPGHVLNSIPLDGGQVLFADFSNEIFDVVDVAAVYRDSGRYKVLKERQRWGLMRALYFYIYMTNDNAATAVIYTNRGNDHAFKGDLNAALADYTRALAIGPHIAGIYSDRGLIYARRADYKKAIADYDRAIEINPNDLDAYNNRGLAYKNEDNFAQAISDYNKALEIDPDSVQVYVNRGNAYSVQGDYKQGILNYTKAIELAPYDVIAYKDRAACYHYLKEYSKSWDDIHKIEKLGGLGAAVR